MGVTLACRNLRSHSWSTPLVVAGLLYGAIGVFRLGVLLDWGLLFAAATLATAVIGDNSGWRSVRADRSERTRLLPGDDLIGEPLGTLTHAITIDAPPEHVWPWIAQMGAGRAGWYSWDGIDNGGTPSATRIGIALRRQRFAESTAFAGPRTGFAVASRRKRPTPATNAVAMFGSVMWRKVCHGSAPRSAEASSIEPDIRRSRAITLL